MSENLFAQSWFKGAPFIVNFEIMIKRVYIDTSVVGGQFDKEFSNDTIHFFNAVANGQLIIVVSDLLEAEL